MCFGDGWFGLRLRRRLRLIGGRLPFGIGGRLGSRGRLDGHGLIGGRLTEHGGGQRQGHHPGGLAGQGKALGRDGAGLGGLESLLIGGIAAGATAAGATTTAATAAIAAAGAAALPLRGRGRGNGPRWGWGCGW